MTLLRPQFTQTLVETLKKQSVNVYGAVGQGQTRLLADVSELARQQGFIVLELDMKAWAENYDGMIAALSRQLRDELSAVTEPMNDLGQFVQALDNHAAEKTVLLLLQHFDSVLDEVLHLDETNYAKFFAHLNSLRNQHRRVLLVMTAKPYNQYRFYVDKIHKTSPLDLTLRELNSLAYEEIKDEVQRRVNPLSDVALLTRTVHDHAQPFDFLEYCIQQLTASNDRQLSTKKLTAWQKRFERDQKKCFRNRLDRFINWLAIAGKEIDNLSTRLKLLLGSVLGLLGLLLGLFDKIKQLLGLNL
jgi:hypothetical protein